MLDIDLMERLQAMEVVDNKLSELSSVNLHLKLIYHLVDINSAQNARIAKDEGRVLGMQQNVFGNLGASRRDQAKRKIPVILQEGLTGPEWQQLQQYLSQMKVTLL